MNLLWFLFATLSISVASLASALLFPWKTKHEILFPFVALAAGTMLGGVAGSFLIDKSEFLAASLLPIATGSFLYIAAAYLKPEVRKQESLPHVFLAFLAGTGVMKVVE